MKTIIIPALALTLLSACSKSDLHMFARTSFSANNASLAFNEAANPANPYDSVGILHNKIVDAVLLRIAANGDTSLQAITAQVIAFAGSKMPAEAALSLSAATAIAIKNAPDNYAQLIEDTDLSNTAKGYLHTLIIIVKDTSAYHNPSSVYPILYNRILGLESQVLSNQQLSSIDRRAVLEVSSVGRYSLFYWLHNDQQYSLKKIIRAMATVCGDIGGAVEGYYTGDVVGTAADASSWWYWNITYGMPG